MIYFSHVEETSFIENTKTVGLYLSMQFSKFVLSDAETLNY